MTDTCQAGDDRGGAGKKTPQACPSVDVTFRLPSEFIVLACVGLGLEVLDLQAGKTHSLK